MKIHIDEQTVDVEAGAVLVRFNVVEDAPTEVPAEPEAATPEAETAPVETETPTEEVGETPTEPTA